jgi:hypothetical protein
MRKDRPEHLKLNSWVKTGLNILKLDPWAKEGLKFTKLASVREKSNRIQLIGESGKYHGADKPKPTQVTRGEKTPLQNKKHVRDRMRMERRRNEGENPRLNLCRRPNPNPFTILRHRSLASHGPSSRHI